MHGLSQQGTEISILTTSALVAHLHVIGTRPYILYTERKQRPPAIKRTDKELQAVDEVILLSFEISILGTIT